MFILQEFVNTLITSLQKSKIILFIMYLDELYRCDVVNFSLLLINLLTAQGDYILVSDIYLLKTLTISSYSPKNW